MGYNVELTDVDFTIPAGKLDEALARLKNLNTDPAHDRHKSGGRWGPGGQEAKWFAWMPENYHETVTSAKEVFELLGFETETDAEGNLSLTYYDSKTGQEDLFINAVGDLANEGWHLDWRGEDDHYWRQEATGTKSGRVVYD